jgi:GTPase SAR1 family protein
LYSK